MIRRGLVCMLLLCGAAIAKPTADSLAEQLVNDGWTLFLAGDLTNARARFEAAHQLVPGKAQPYRLLGLTDARLHRCDEAVKSLSEFLKRIEPSDPRYSEAITVRDSCRSQEAPPVLTPSPTPEPIVAAPPPPPPAPRPSHRRVHIAVGVTVGVLVVGAVAVGLAVGLTQPQRSPYDSAVLFPAVKP